MAEVKPAEVSAILKNQLAGYDSALDLNEIGTVLEVGDGIARVFGLTNAQYGELVSFDSGLEGMVLNLEEDNVGIVLFGPSKELKEGDTVKRTQRIASIKVGEGIVGRVVNTLGIPIDGKGSIEGIAGAEAANNASTGGAIVRDHGKQPVACHQFSSLRHRR